MGGILMRRLTSIVAVNHEGVIGAGNTLPWRLKSDMKFFREQTMGNVVLMGRKTYDSLGHRCLPHRFNVVISHSFGLLASSDACTSAIGIEDGLFRASLAPKKYKDSLVIGGASMYKQYAPFVDRYLVTLVDKEVPNGDTYFDQEFLGDPDTWNIHEMFRLPASEVDETAFTVFEITARKPARFYEERQDAIGRARIAATSGLQSRTRIGARRVAGGYTTYSMF